MSDKNRLKQKVTVPEINKLIQELTPEEREMVSDGFHEFREIYEHRVRLFVTLCNILIRAGAERESQIWKSRLHSDGTMFEGFFIAGITGPKEKQTITYHLPLAHWKQLESKEIQFAPEWDGHTSEDVLNLLYTM